MKKSTGIYKITNIVSNQLYVGSSTSCIKSRWGYHLRDLRANKHHSSKLQNSFNKYGENSFVFEILEIVDDKSSILAREQFYIDELVPFFNTCRIAGNCLGVKHSEETRQRMSISKRGKPSPRKGVKVSEETKLKQSLSKMGKVSKRKGTKCSDETKLKMSESAKKRTRVYTDETRKKLSEAANKRWSKQCPS